MDETQNQAAVVTALRAEGYDDTAIARVLAGGMVRGPTNPERDRRDAEQAAAREKNARAFTPALI